MMTRKVEKLPMLNSNLWMWLWIPYLNLFSSWFNMHSSHINHIESRLSWSSVSNSDIKIEPFGIRRNHFSTITIQTHHTITVVQDVKKKRISFPSWGKYKVHSFTRPIQYLSLCILKMPKIKLFLSYHKNQKIKRILVLPFC